MGKVIYDISMSLDGFITGANARAEEGWAGLGEGGERLHAWGFNSSDPRNSELAETMFATLGAVITGRTTYNHSILNWGANGPTGDARLPTIIVSHSVPQNVPANGVYTFVDSIEAAHVAAQKAAGDKDIIIHGGNVAEQFITRGYVDELFIHLAPVLFGSGARLVGDLGGGHAELEAVEVIQTKEAIHLRYRIVK